MKRLIAAAAIALAGPAAGQEGIETPDYDLIAGDDAVFEGGVAHRLYAPTIVAEVAVEAQDAREASSIGFMPLANYIFGANEPGENIAMTAPVAAAPVVSERGGMSGGSGEKIAMTAPVGTAPEGDGTYRVRFHMPSEWTMDTLPAPEDPAVTFREIPERAMVVAGFTGPESDEEMRGAEERARLFAEENGLEITGPFERAGYDGPDTPDAEKRWAVMAEVAG